MNLNSLLIFTFLFASLFVVTSQSSEPAPKGAPPKGKNRINEIKIFAGSYDIKGWVECDGRILNRDPYFSSYQSLASRFGGNNTQTFGLPDLRDSSAAWRRIWFGYNYEKVDSFRFLIAIEDGILPRGMSPKAPSNGMIGEIRLSPLTSPPDGWVFCDGSELRIQDFPDLYALIGTSYGGDGKETFGVPDLGRIAPLTIQLKEEYSREKAQLEETKIDEEFEAGALGRQLGSLAHNYRSAIALGGDKLGKDKLRYMICTTGAVPSRDAYEVYDPEHRALPYVGEVTLFAGNFAPQGWDYCDGRKLPITGNTDHSALFSVLGIEYGGDGMSNFGLPDCTRVEKFLALSVLGVQNGPRYLIFRSQYWDNYPLRTR